MSDTLQPGDFRRPPLKLRMQAALHEIRCTECRVTWRSWVRRILGTERGYTP